MMKKVLKFAIVAIIFVGVLMFAFGGGADAIVESEMDKIENQVALEAVEQYEIAKNNGSEMDAYIQAGMVSAAYLQASDEENYKKWKEIEQQHAKKIGLQP